MPDRRQNCIDFLILFVEAPTYDAHVVRPVLPGTGSMIQENGGSQEGPAQAKIRG